MIPRTLEPEVMDTQEEAVDYDSMDHSQVNRAFVDAFLELAAKHGFANLLADPTNPLNILDVGTGTALIPIALCRRSVHCQVTAIDLAGEMLKLARRNVSAAHLDGAIMLEQVDAKHMPYGPDHFDAVISNSIVHHIPQPQSAVGEILRVLRSDGLLIVRDLLRPNDLETLEQLVATYAGDENDHQQQMFRDSLHAALTLDEVRAMIREFGLPAECASQTTDRHWTISCRI